jgi:nucleoside-diphosphate-sugar epimerase
MPPDMRVTIIGANGFVGTGLVRFLAAQPGVQVNAVTRQNYDSLKGQPSDITIESSCNSKKFLSDNEPLKDLDLSVVHRLRTLRDFPAALHIHISSVDVYSDLVNQKNNFEDAPIDVVQASNYGVHKRMAEDLVRHYASKWLILRLAGMVGPGLRKNPVYDITHGQPLRIHPESQYQFMHTSEVARVLWELAQKKVTGEIYNVCGTGLISPNQIAQFAGKQLDLSLLPADAKPRIVDVNNDKIRKFTTIGNTVDAVKQFISEAR